LNIPMSVVSAKEHEAVVRTQELAMRLPAQKGDCSSAAKNKYSTCNLLLQKIMYCRSKEEWISGKCEEDDVIYPY
jgi:hypothetical protein